MIRTWGELKQWAKENDVTDDTPTWMGAVSVQGGLEYFDRIGKYEIEVALHEQTFGLALPPEHRETETGMVFY